MLAVFKYEIPMTNIFDIELHERYQILTVQAIDNTPYMWVLTDMDSPHASMKFRLAGTGHKIDFPQNQLHYVNTFQLFDGEEVYHLFLILD